MLALVAFSHKKPFPSLPHRQINTSAVVQHGHAVPIDLEYHYAAVPGTNFSLGVVLPKQWKHWKPPAAGPTDLKAELGKEDDKELHLAPWKYCKESKAQDYDTFKGITEEPACKLSTF